MGINNVTLCGNLTRDAEVRSTSGGTSISEFGIAVNERRKNALGEWEDYPNFIDCAMFGVRAEKLSQYLKKGMKVTVQGHLHQSRWEKDGQNRSRIEVIVDEVELPPRSSETFSETKQEQPELSDGIPF